MKLRDDGPGIFLIGIVVVGLLMSGHCSFNPSAAQDTAPPKSKPREPGFNPGAPPRAIDCLSAPLPPGSTQWDQWAQHMEWWRCMQKRYGIEPDQPTAPWPGPSRLPK